MHLVRDSQWIVKGELVGLTATSREAYLERRRLYGNDPVTSELTSGWMPPFTQEVWEQLYDEKIAPRTYFLFEVRLIETDKCIGEASLQGLSWPDASCELGLVIWVSDERGQRYGTEAGLLTAAYAFDGLGVNRVWIKYLASNRAVAKIAESIPGKEVARLRESAWAFGRFEDEIIRDCIKSEWPDFPHTSHLRDIGG